jgi:hypothetical protein
MMTSKLGHAQTDMGKPGTKISELCSELGARRQALYCHMNRTDQLRPDGKSYAAGREKIPLDVSPRGEPRTIPGACRR